MLVSSEKLFHKEAVCFKFGVVVDKLCYLFLAERKYLGRFKRSRLSENCKEHHYLAYLRSVLYVLLIEVAL